MSKPYFGRLTVPELEIEFCASEKRGSNADEICATNFGGPIQ